MEVAPLHYPSNGTMGRPTRHPKLRIYVDLTEPRPGPVVTGFGRCRHWGYVMGVDLAAGGVAAADTAEHLFVLTDRLFRACTLEDVYAAALDAIGTLLGSDRASILLFNDQNVMDFAAWRGLSDDYRRAVRGHTPWVAGQPHADPVFVPDIGETSEPHWLKRQIAAESITGLAFVPLFANGGVVGKFMTYFPDRREFTSRDRDCAVAIARQVGFSLERHLVDAARQTAEARLRASEERFRHMAEDAPIMIWISDGTGHCVDINSLLRDFWGVSNVETFDWSTTLHPDDLEHVTGAMQDAVQRHSNVKVRGRYRRFDGAYRVLETVARPNFGPAGEFVGMIGVNADVTEREEADQHKRLLINELNHRVKNTLAVVQAMSRQTFKSDAARNVQMDAFEGRLRPSHRRTTYSPPKAGRAHRSKMLPANLSTATSTHASS